MQQRVPLLLLALVLVGGASPQSTSMAVGATVIAKCTVTNPVALAFGTYDPVVANHTMLSPLDVSPNALSVSCTRGAPNVTIGLDNGLHYANPDRYLSDGTHTLQYEIYTTSGRSTVWNSTNTVSYSSSSMAASAQPVYGRIPGGQDAYVNASYADTVIATVNF